MHTTGLRRWVRLEDRLERSESPVFVIGFGQRGEPAGLREVRPFALLQLVQKRGGETRIVAAVMLAIAVLLSFGTRVERTGNASRRVAERTGNWWQRVS